MKRTSGLDIGANSLKGVRLERAGDRVLVKNLAIQALGDLRKQEDADMFARDLRVYLRAIAKSGKLNTANLKVMPPARATTIKHMSFPPVPPTRLQEMIRFEVTENMAGNRAVSYAWQSLSTDAPDQMAIVLGVVEEEELKYLNTVLKSAGLRANHVDAAIMALTNAYRFGYRRDEPLVIVGNDADSDETTELPDDELGIDFDEPSDSQYRVEQHEKKEKEKETRAREDTVALVDIGAEQTILVLMHKAEPVHIRVMAGGGDMFTQTIARTLNIPLEQAETYKRMDAEVVPTLTPGAGPGERRFRRKDASRLSALEIRRRLLAQREARGLTENVDDNSGSFAQTTNSSSDRPADSREQVSGGKTSLSGIEMETDAGRAADDDNIDSNSDDAFVLNLDSFAMDGGELDVPDITDSPDDDARLNGRRSSTASGAPIEEIDLELPGFDSVSDGESVDSAGGDNSDPGAAPSTDDAETRPGAYGLSSDKPGSEVDVDSVSDDNGGLREDASEDKYLDAGGGDDDGAGDDVDDLKLAGGDNDLPAGYDTATVGGHPSVGVARKKVSRALMRDFAGLAAAIENSVVFARQVLRTRGIHLDKVLITGAGSRLKGMDTMLQRRLRVPVEKLDPFRNLDTSGLKDDAKRIMDSERDRFALAVGAALSEMYDDAATFVFTTQDDRRREWFLNRTIFNWYAAVLFIAAVVLMIYIPIRNKKAVHAEEKRVAMQLETAETTKRKIQQAIEDNDRLFEERKALEAREYSGDFLIRVLAELRRHCNANLFITELSTSKPQFLINISKYKTKRGRSSDEIVRMVREAETLVERGKLYIRGVVRSDEGRQAAQNLLLNTFLPTLTRLSPTTGEVVNPDAVFEMCSVLWVSPTEFTKRIRGKKNIMLEFVIECNVGNRFSPVPDESNRQRKQQE